MCAGYHLTLIRNYIKRITPFYKYMNEIITDYLDAKQLADRLTALELNSTSELARLERERDEAREERDKLKQLLAADSENVDAYLGVCIERDEAREKVEQQRKEIVRLNGATNHAGGTPLKIALRERDEAREQAQQMSESNQLLMADVRFYRNAWEQLKDATK